VSDFRDAVVGSVAALVLTVGAQYLALRRLRGKALEFAGWSGMLALPLLVLLVDRALSRWQRLAPFALMFSAMWLLACANMVVAPHLATHKWHWLYYVCGPGRRGTSTKRLRRVRLRRRTR